MTRPLVIGYGNTLRGDDGAGVRAAERIRGRAGGVDVLTVHELEPGLAETIAGRSVVVFIDASTSAGSLSCVRLGDDTPSAPVRSHLLTPEQLLALSRLLYGAPPGRAFLVGIPARDFAFSDLLSERTASFLDPCVRLVETLTRHAAASLASQGENP